MLQAARNLSLHDVSEAIQDTGLPLHLHSGIWHPETSTVEQTALLIDLLFISVAVKLRNIVSGTEPTLVVINNM